MLTSLLPDASTECRAGYGWGGVLVPLSPAARCSTRRRSTIRHTRYDGATDDLCQSCHVGWPSTVANLQLGRLMACPSIQRRLSTSCTATVPAQPASMHVLAGTAALVTAADAASCTSPLLYCHLHPITAAVTSTLSCCGCRRASSWH
jgi:hypothetical protein